MKDQLLHRKTGKKHKKKRKKTRIPGIQEENRTTVWKINFYIGKQEKNTKKREKKHEFQESRKKTGPPCEKSTFTSENRKKTQKKRKKTRIPGIQEENRTTMWKINFYIGKQEKNTKKKEKKVIFQKRCVYITFFHVFWNSGFPFVCLFFTFFWNSGFSFICLLFAFFWNSGFSFICLLFAFFLNKNTTMFPFNDSFNPKCLAPVLPYKLMDRTTPQNRIKLSWFVKCSKIQVYDMESRWYLLPMYSWNRPLPKYQTHHLKPIIFQSFTCCNKISHPPRKKYKNCRIPFNNTALHPWNFIIWNLKITQLTRKIMFHPPPFVGSKCQLFQGVYSMGPPNLHV